jgi:ATP-dependent helicase/nuclease subunit B
MLLSVILKKETPFLEAFAAQAAARPFIEMMNDLLSELKLHNVSPAEIADMAEAETRPILKRKLSDVSRVYGAYEELIRGKYLDSEDMLRVFASGIPRSAFVKETEIWMYGFDRLTPRDLDIVQALAARARGVNVVLTGEAQSGNGQTSSQSSLFRITERMTEALRERACAAGCAFALRGADGGFAARRPPAVAHIERELFNYPCRPWNGGETPELTFLAASDYHTEAESAAAEIARLVRDEGFRYRDILVICNDPDARAAVIRRVFSEYGLPVFMDRRKNLHHNPVLEYISSLMDAAALDWRPDDIFRLIKTGLSPVSRVQCELLEEYAKSFRFRGKSHWNKPFERLSPYERRYAEEDGGAPSDEKKLSLLNEARGLLVTHIRRFTEMLNADRGVAGRTAALYTFLRDEALLPERIEADVASLRARGRHEYADELSQVWNSVVDVFDQMAAILGDTPMSREDYASLLSAGLESIEIGLLPSTTDQILVGTMQRTRAGRIRALFVLGANDGVLPAAGGRDGVLNEDERARVLGRSGDTDALDRLRAEEEELAIYRNLSRPEEKLWISYAVSGPEGGELRPSLIFERLRGIFPESVCALERDIRSRADASEPGGGSGGALCRVSTAGGTLESLLLALRAPSANRALDPVWRAVYDWYRAHAPREAAMLDRGFAFSNGVERRIDRGYAERLYGAYSRYDHGCDAEAAPSIRLSPSSLERYSRCPFSHFVSHGLRPRETRVVEIGAREIGDVFHRAIMEFSKALTEEGVRVSDADSAWMRLTEADCEKLIDEIFDAMRGEAEVFGRGEPERYRLERMRATVGTAARIVAEQVKAGLIDEMYFEERFGDGGKFPPIIHSLGDLTVGIEGRIDRLDVLRGGRAKIIDYKSGAESFDAEEARAGWRLQLMLYLDAVTRGASLKPAGVFYFKVSEPRTNCGSWSESGDSITERAESELRKKFRLDGVLIDDQEVLRAIAGDVFEEPHYVNNRSNIIPVRVSKDKATGEYVLVKSSYSTSALLDEEAFERLRGDAAQRVRECCEALANGVIDAAPMRAGNTSACAYCAYNGICGRDAALGS